ncbi:response regulator [Patescibacteria group bacterium]|nr:response regulator [Patescibacteria group bacterium]
MKKILIIEDDQALALAYEKKFSQAAFAVERAEDGHAGLSKATQFEPDIIILDIMLPGGMNGFDILRQLKLSNTTKNIPVIVMTNLAEQGQSALELGAEEYLLKVNISLKDLVKKVKKIVKNKNH